ncbi:MAG: tRNA1(Val) (adenine(37)-N6)-methyltransferase [Clostridiales bacterium]|nr:tRNA1(Val) (adenine(37)-N6)-methyltransferase [Clostridiales bacterium]
MASDTLRRSEERLDDLQNHGLKIFQKKDGFRFGMDAVLLAHFCRPRPRDRVADLGTGTGILPLLISRMEPTAHLIGIEWQRPMAEMAERSVRLNSLQERITILCDDYRNAPLVLGEASMQGVVCNPPYGKRGGAIPSDTQEHRLARHETACALSETIAACAALLCCLGRLWMAFPPERALELLDGLRAHRLEPKRIRMVYAKASKAPYLMLVEAVKHAKPALLWLPPLIVYHEDGTETRELVDLYAGRAHAQGLAAHRRQVRQAKGTDSGRVTAETGEPDTVPSTERDG